MYPLAWLRAVAVGIKDIIVGVVMLRQLVPQHVEWLQCHHTLSAPPDSSATTEAFVIQASMLHDPSSSSLMQS